MLTVADKAAADVRFAVTTSAANAPDAAPPNVWRIPAADSDAPVNSSDAVRKLSDGSSWLKPSPKTLNEIVPPVRSSA